MKSIGPAICLSLALLPGAAFAEQKTDWYGFRPGMSYDEVKSVISKGSYKCKEFITNLPSFTCQITDDVVTVQFTPNLRPMVVERVTRAFTRFSDFATVANDIAQQFGDKVEERYGNSLPNLPYGWEWRDGTHLNLAKGQKQSNGQMLYVATIWSMDVAKADGIAYRQKHPEMSKPKSDSK